jgi:hypothetical protein
VLSINFENHILAIICWATRLQYKAVFLLLMSICRLIKLSCVSLANVIGLAWKFTKKYNAMIKQFCSIYSKADLIPSCFNILRDQQDKSHSILSITYTCRFSMYMCILVKVNKSCTFCFRKHRLYFWIKGKYVFICEVIMEFIIK